MNLKDVAETALIFSPEDMVSKVASEMRRKNRQEALVFEGGKYLGTLSAKSLVKKKIGNPGKTKLGSVKSAINNIAPLSPGVDVKEAADIMITNGYRSVPLKAGNDYLIATKLDLLKLVPKEVFRGRKAEDVASFPPCISMDDSLAVARSLLRDTGVNQLVLMGPQNRAEGIIDSVGLLGMLVDRTRPKRAGLAEEKTGLDDVLASSPTIKHNILVKVSPETPLQAVVKSMLKKGSNVAVVEDDKFRGIITPAFILKLLSSEVSGIHVRITGQQDEDGFIKSVIDEEIRNEVKKLARIIPIDYFTVNVSRHSPEGKRVKYSLKAQLITQKGMFFSKSFAWDLTKAMRELLGRLEREVIKQKEKARTIKRSRTVDSTRGKY